MTNENRAEDIVSEWEAWALRGRWIETKLHFKARDKLVEAVSAELQATKRKAAPCAPIGSDQTEDADAEMKKLKAKVKASKKAATA